ncbi:MAG: hypothetical protein AAGF11_32805 [Myxococcota bacterium]
MLASALCGCGSDAPAPKSPPSPAPKKKELDKKELDKQPPSRAPSSTRETQEDLSTEPEPLPDIPAEQSPIVRCTIRVDGGPRIKTAAVKVQSGELRPGEVEDTGYAVDYDCPDYRDRKGVNLIAKLENDEQVHWTNIHVGDDMNGTVASSESNKGLPELTPEQRELLEEQGFEVTETVAPPPPPKKVKVPVIFWPHKLPWAELQLEGRGKPRTVTLAGKRSYPLYPGRYDVMIRKDPDGEFESAGTLTIEGGKSHTVKLIKRPLGFEVTSK